MELILRDLKNSVVWRSFIKNLLRNIVGKDLWRYPFFSLVDLLTTLSNIWDRSFLAKKLHPRFFLQNSNYGSASGDYRCGLQDKEMIKIQRKKKVWIKERGKIVKKCFAGCLWIERITKLPSYYSNYAKRCFFKSMVDSIRIPPLRSL